jgi:predicted permease
VDELAVSAVGQTRRGEANNSRAFARVLVQHARNDPGCFPFPFPVSWVRDSIGTDIMILTALTVLLPVFFVLLLGYFAGRAKEFNANQVAGLNDLVLDYALPAMMFVATVKTPREQLLSEGPYALALLVAFVGLFLAVVLVSTRLLHHSLGEATLQANLASFPSVGFFGSPIFKGLFGPSSLVSIAFATTLSAITMIPLTLACSKCISSRRRVVKGSAFVLLFF